MKPIILDIPDSFPDRRAWLERQLVGLELGDLVAELQAIHQSRSPDAAPSPPLKEAFAGLLPKIMKQGLTVLTEKQLGLLLKHPRLLSELQDVVLEHGGKYWDTVPRSEEFEQRVAASRDKLTQKLAGQASTAPSAKRSTSTPPTEVTSGSGSVRRKLYTLLAIAAALLVGATLWMSRPSAPTWGFDRSGILTAKLSPTEYLNTLATAAGDWFNKRPEDQAAVATRLREFIHGCDTLINAPHSQLSPEDRAWLVERCRETKSALEVRLADLETNRSPVANVRESADKAIQKLQEEFRRRAEDVA